MLQQLEGFQYALALDLNMGYYTTFDSSWYGAVLYKFVDTMFFLTPLTKVSSGPKKKNLIKQIVAKKTFLNNYPD
jgi:hypothetical protein